MADSKDKSLARNLGQFFGFIFRSAKADVEPRKQVLRRDVEEQRQGNVTLRRTTIEEVEFGEDDRGSDR